MTPRIHTIFSVGATLVVAVALVWGFVLAGSPATSRLQRLDQRRLDDLQTIFREIQSLCHDPDIKDTLKRPLPQSLDQLATLARRERINLSDPETAQRYRYVVTSETTYEVCATFSLPRDSDSNVFWNHPAGEHCFTIDALDPP